VTDFDVALARAAALDEQALAQPWTYLGQSMDMRFAIYRTLEDGQEALVALAAGPHPEARRILALAQRAFGDLRGLLVGLPLAILDEAPGDGEWTIRQTLGHMVTVERRYALQTAYAVERGDGDPVRIPADRLDPAAHVDVSGGIEALLARLGAARAETNRRLGELTPEELLRPTVWLGCTIDVRFRLHRFAAHVIEHSIQCEKTLGALGWWPAEGQRIGRRLAALLGELEGLGGADQARAIETRLAERLASTGAA
jgi:uncharacterized damage-inducible protein DinB